MSHKLLAMISGAILPVLLAGGCAPPTADEAAPPSPAAAALKASNGLSFNGLSFNGMSFNGLSFNGMSFNGLSFNGLSFNGMSFNGMSFNGLSFNGLRDPVVKGFVSYLVQCALPENDSVTYEVDGASHTFQGSIGLAPEWKTESCGPSCQRWISACLLARLNKAGEHVPVSLRGEHPALKTERKEERDYPVREATYYGNLFEAPEKIFLCHAPGTPSVSRVCGDSLASCPMQVAGSCDEVCRPGRHQSFRDCKPGPTNKGPSETFEEAITVFLKE